MLPKCQKCDKDAEIYLLKGSFCADHASEVVIDEIIADEEDFAKWVKATAPAGQAASWHKAIEDYKSKRG